MSGARPARRRRTRGSPIDRVADDLAGVAHHEEVAEALVEDDLRRQARVGAAEQCRAGARWHGGRLVAVLDVLAGMLGFAGDEALVAAHHLPPHLAGALVDRSPGGLLEGADLVRDRTGDEGEVFCRRIAVDEDLIGSGP